MGNTVSTWDYDTQVKQSTQWKYSDIVSPADAERGWGEIYRNNYHEELPVGWTPPGSTDLVTNLLRAVEFGGRKCGVDGEFLGAREYRVEENVDPPKPEKAAKNYKFSGYQERKDGTVNRFDYKWMTYGQVSSAYKAFGRGLISLGIQPGSHAGIFSVNCPAWLISQYAYWSQRLTVVPLYATLGPDAIEYITNHAELPVVVVSKENFNNFAKILDKVQDTVKHVILMDGIENNFWGNSLDAVTPEQRAVCEKHGINIHNMSEIIQLGREHEEIPEQDAQGDELAYICYTSGTTGVPKGVMLPHKSLCATLDADQKNIACKKGEIYFSYLPLSHIFEVICNVLCISGGMKVAFSQGDVRQLTSDLQASQPHIIPGVPRIWTKFYQGIFSTIDNMPFIKRWYVYRAYNYQLNQLRNNLPLDPSYDEKVFKPMREKLGLNNAHTVVTGAAASGAYLVEFMRVLLGGKWFTCGYGMTESCAGTSVTRPIDNLIGHSGAPFGVDYRVASLPDMGYLHTDEHPRGELLLSGTPVTTGYYKMKEATDAALIPDATGRLWYRTGDVVRINKTTGTICIIDRAKSLLKLSQGEYVSLEKVTNCYGQSPLVGQIFVYGNAFKSNLVAVVAPNVVPLHQYAVEKGWWSGDAPVPGALTDEIVQQYQTVLSEHKKDITDWIMASLQQCETGLLGFEKVKAVHVDCSFDALGQVFTEPKGLLTPTMKLKAQPLAKFYVEQLRELYTIIDEPDHGETAYW